MFTNVLWVRQYSPSLSYRIDLTEIFRLYGTFVPLPDFCCAVTVNLLYIRLYNKTLHSMNTDWELIYIIFGVLCITSLYFIDEPDQINRKKPKRGCLLNVNSLQNKVLHLHKLFSYPERLQHEVLCTGKYTKCKHWRYGIFFSVLRW